MYDRVAPWGRAALDLFFPPRCTTCDGAVPASTCPLRRAFCSACLCHLEPLGREACPACARPLARPGTCPACCTCPPPWRRAVAAFTYGGAMRAAVLRMKFGRRPWIAAALGEVLGFALRQAALGPELVTFVPLHPARLRARTFDQAALIAGPVARSLGPVVPLALLRRDRAAPPQATASRTARLRA
ncbi:MAG: ComF family protein, partial [Deltaproteobacteria bacterium]